MHFPCFYILIVLYPKIYFPLSSLFLCVFVLSGKHHKWNTEKKPLSFTSSRLAEWPKISPQAPFLLGKKLLSKRKKSPERRQYDRRKGFTGHTLSLASPHQPSPTSPNQTGRAIPDLGKRGTESYLYCQNSKLAHQSCVFLLFFPSFFVLNTVILGSYYNPKKGVKILCTG